MKSTAFHSHRHIFGIARRFMLLIAGMVAAMSASSPIHAQVLDNFDAPIASTSRVVQNTASTTVYESALPVLGGARDTTLNVYGNPLNSTSVVTLGGGRLSVAQGTKATAETIVAYGAFTRVGGNQTVGGPLLGLDLSTQRTLRFDFSGAEDVLNVNVTYYTSAPITPNVYYAGGGINIAPSASGAPLSFTLPVSNDPSFNWKKVDGVVVLINRSGPTPHTSYTLDRLSFQP
jgi:hypothetical protein